MGRIQDKVCALFMAVATMSAIGAAIYRVYIVRHRAMPPDLAEIELIRWIDELGRIAKYGSKCLHYLGINPGIEPLKIFVNTAFSFLVSPKPGDRIIYRNIRVSQDLYAGVPVNTYSPVRVKHKKDGYPTIIYFHGGGWTWLSVGVYDQPLKHLANSTNFKVVAVEYRKAPQHPFPAAYDDSLAVTRYIIKNSRELNINRDLVVLAGDGAGGNLAAAVATEMSSLIRLQILINPALQMMNFATPSYQDNADTLLSGITSVEKEVDSWIRYGNINVAVKPDLMNNRHVSLNHYEFLSDFIDSQRRMQEYPNITDRHTIHNSICRSNVSAILDPFVLDTRINPMFAFDVRNVPDTYIITSNHDVLRDEALMYGHRLKENGVEVEVLLYRHGFHGFLLFAGGGWLELEVSRRAMDDLAYYLHTEVLELPPTSVHAER